MRMCFSLITLISQDTLSRLALKLATLDLITFFTVRSEGNQRFYFLFFFRERVVAQKPSANGHRLQLSAGKVSYCLQL